MSLGQISLDSCMYYGIIAFIHSTFIRVTIFHAVYLSKSRARQAKSLRLAYIHKVHGFVYIYYYDMEERMLAHVLERL